MIKEIKVEIPDYKVLKKYKNFNYDKGIDGFKNSNLITLTELFYYIEQIKYDANRLYSEMFQDLSNTKFVKQRYLNSSFQDLFESIKKIKHIFGW